MFCSNFKAELQLSQNIYDLLLQFEHKLLSQKFGLLPQQNNNPINVLVFPPLNAKGRYLVHESASKFIEFKTVSVGKEPHRRTVVYYLNSSSSPPQQFLSSTTSSDSEKKGLQVWKMSSEDLSSSPRFSKRPDKAIYVPKHRRITDNSMNEQHQTEVSEEKKILNRKKNGTKKKKTKTDLEEIQSPNTHSKQFVGRKKKIDKTKQEKSSIEDVRLTKKTPTYVASLVENNLSIDCSKLSLKESTGLATPISINCIKTSNPHNELKEASDHNLSSKIIQFCAESYSESLIKECFFDIYNTLRNIYRSDHNKEVFHKKKVTVFTSPEQQRNLLPGMATNFVNLAIENAMEIMKAVKSYEQHIGNGLSQTPRTEFLPSAKLISSRSIVPNTVEESRGNTIQTSIQPVTSILVENSETYTKHFESDITTTSNNSIVSVSSIDIKEGTSVDPSSISFENKNILSTKTNVDNSVIQEITYSTSSNQNYKESKEHKELVGQSQRSECIKNDNSSESVNSLTLSKSHVPEQNTANPRRKKPEKLKKDKGRKIIIPRPEFIDYTDDCPIEKRLVDKNKRIVKVYHDTTEKNKKKEDLADVLKNESEQLHIQSKDQNETINCSEKCNLKGESDDDWDSNWTEDGECLNGDMLEELTKLTGIKNPVVEKAEVIDYLDFQPKSIDLDEGEFGHILELFDFSVYLKTQDLFNALNTIGINDYNITWVDDTHALAVFSSRSSAHYAMKQYTPVLQMRQVINGTRQSRTKARDFKDALLPYKRRPATTASVARNLVAGALGIKSQLTLEQRRKERELLKEAREEKRKKAKLKKDIWDNPE